MTDGKQGGKDREGAGTGGLATPESVFATMLGLQTEFASSLLGSLGPAVTPTALALEDGALGEWNDMAASMQELWASLVPEQLRDLTGAFARQAADPAQWQDLGKGLVANWYRQLPFADDASRQRLLHDQVQLWESVLGRSGLAGGQAGEKVPDLPRHDPRFADPRWRDQPLFALLHQSHLLFAEQLTGLVERVEGLSPARKDQLRFATRAVLEAMSPANFPLTNPIVLDRLVETRGESLKTGLQHMLADLQKGQLTQSAPDAFEVGVNLAATPGKVVHETPLFQLIQYSPATPSVLETPLVIFPPWINRFYILDLTPAKSFVRWALEQGVTVLMVSWKSADSSMAEVVWDDYIRAQIEAIEVTRKRLKVPAVHTIGYCVAGTTLAATLAILSRRGEADKVRSATFFTAQVDFELAGDLRNFVDDAQIALAATMATDGYLDGRIMASVFNLLRGRDLIWNYVVDNYLLGKDYRPFDLLHWNGDSTNVPARWHQNYLRDLYRDNLLVVPDRLSGDGTPIDLRRITTPCFIQAGREDHIAPAPSVWRLTRLLAGPWTFLLAGSGHIAGVVNPPAAGKYQYWLNPQPGETLDDFVAGAEEHPGSWWPCWIEWLRAHDPKTVPARGKRVPGSRGDKVIEDAPGRYVRER